MTPAEMIYQIVAAAMLVGVATVFISRRISNGVGCKGGKCSGVTNEQCATRCGDLNKRIDDVSKAVQEQLAASAGHIEHIRERVEDERTGVIGRLSKLEGSVELCVEMLKKTDKIRTGTMGGM